MPGPFEDSARRVLAQRAYGSIYSGQYADALKSAQANELATRLGMPADVVEADMPNMLAEDRLRKRNAEIQRNAAYAKVMSNPRLASAAIDDDALPEVASKVAAHAAALPEHRLLPMIAGGGYQAVFGRLMAGTANVVEGAFGLGQAASEVAGPALSSNPLLRAFLAGSKGAAEGGSRIAKATRYETGNRNIDDILSGIESVPGSVAALGVTLATGNPALGVGVLGATTGGQSYRAGREAGLTPNEAVAYGGADAVIEAATEIGPEMALGGLAKPGASVVGALGLNVASEVPGEVTATALQGLNRWYWIDRGKGVTFQQFMAALPDQERSTIVSTLTMVGLTGAVAVPMAKAAQRSQDQRSAQAVDSIMESAAASPTRTANPTHFAEALNQLVGDTGAENIYVPADQVQALFETEGGKDIAADPFWSKYAAQVHEAAALGGDVIIPLSDAATHLAGTPQWAALRDHVRTSPQGASIAEAKAKQTPEELEAMAADVATRIDSKVRGNQQREAMRAVSDWAQGMGYSGERATAINRYLASWLANAHARETAKRAESGEAAPTIEEFAKATLPSRTKGKQSDYKASVRGTQAANEDVQLGEAAQTPEKTARRIGRKRTSARKPVSAIAFIRQIGGIKDNEGHDLSKGRGLRRHPGLINNKRGRSVDAIGELLWEAGYFPLGSTRPTEAQVLELIEDANRRPIYTRSDQADAMLDAGEQNRLDADEEQGGEAVARAALDAEITRLDLNFIESDREIAMSFMAEGMTAEEAIHAAFTEIEMQLLEELDEESTSGYKYGDVADEIFAGQEGRAGFEGGLPGFDDLEGPEGTREPGAGEPGSTLRETIGRFFGKPGSDISIAEPGNQFDIWDYVNGTEEPLRRDPNTLPPRRGGAIRALGIADDLRRERSAALVGRTASNSGELAQIAQIYRDPRFETLRVFFMDGDTIVHATGVSARLASEAPLLPGGKGVSEFNRWLVMTKAQVGADGYYLLHNHPTGDPNPSRVDIQVTQAIARSSPGFRGHVVINSNKYASISEAGESVVTEMNLGDDLLLKASKPHPVLGQPVSNGQQLVAIGKMLQQPGQVTVIGTDAKLRTRVIADYPEADLLRPQKVLMAGLRRLMRQSGSDQMFIVGSREALQSEAVGDAVRANLVTEAIDFDGQPSGVWSKSAGKPLGFTPEGRFVAEDDLGFGETPQPARTMTQAQRAELDARQQQSMARRGGQESLKDQEGGLFSAERDQDTLFQPAFHGSPHIFDRFSLGRIGTGEGSQAYGWGLYFAGQKEVAQHYRDALSSASSISIGGQDLVGNDAKTALADRVSQMHPGVPGIDVLAADAIELVRRHGKHGPANLLNYYSFLEKSSAPNSGEIWKAVQDMAGLMKDIKPLGEGRLYEVEIPDDEEYLLWDKPLSEQSPEVRTALAALLQNRSEATADPSGLPPAKYSADDLPSYTGSTYYGAITGDYGGQEGASKALHDAGIAGIKYLDGSSRADGDGSYNYVVFDDSRVSIEAYEQALNDAARGNITISRDEAGFMSSALIRAFESANFSTAIHELGHFFLEDLRTRALRNDATPQEKADWETFKTWALDDLSGLLVADDAIIPTEAHEFFARGMERYIWEGQAPAKGLRGLFARMREFMLELYRTATSFNAPITPEIREVMDRMVASEAEIAEARADMNLASTAISELLTNQERKELADAVTDAREEATQKLLDRILSALRSERTSEFQERKRELKAEVEEQVDGEPIFRALRLLRTGIPDADGNRLKVKLSREWLTDTYGPDVIASLPKGVPPIIGDTDTMDADQLAGMAGFSSGDELVKAMIAHESARAASKAAGDNRSPRSKLIGDTVDARLREEIGDPFADLEDEARAALANDRQAEALSLELRAIARKAGRKPTPWKLATDWARERISHETAKDALSGRMLQQYARNASKAGQDVEDGLISQDFETAFMAKQRQLLNLALLQEARRAKEAVDKAVRRMGRLAGKATIRSVDQDYLEQAHQLLEDVDLKARPQTQVDKRLAFETWHAAQVANGIEPVVPAEYRRLLGKQHWSRLAIEDLIELDRTVGQIVELGRLKRRLRDAKADRDYEEGVAELADVAGRLPPRNITTDLNPNRKFGGRIKSRLRGLDAAMVKVEQMVDWLDSGNSNGPWNRLIFGVMAEAQGHENDLMRTYVERINGLIKALPKKQVAEWDRRVDTPELTIQIPGHPQRGEPFQFSKDQVVMLAMNWGNEGNRQRLLDGFGWSEEQVLPVLDRLMTKDDWDFVQGVWDTVNGLWPDIEALERRVNGVAPEKVEATEVLTRHGAYRGGYFPAVYDPNYSTRTELDEASKLSPSGAWHQATTRASSTNARAAAVKGRPLLLSMSVITRHLGEVIHDVTHREAVGQVRKLLADSRVRSSVSSTLGPEYLKRMGAWLENIATPNAANSKSDPSMVALARHLNKGVSLVGLGFRITSAIVQPLGMSNMVGIVGEKAVANGLRIATAHPIQTYNEVMSRSAEMRSRFSTMDASIEDMAAEANAGKLKLIGARGLVKHAFDGILYMDMLITTSGWIGAYNKGLTEGMGEDEAVYYADKAIRTSQGAGGQKDRSAILYENQFARTFWPFFSYLNALYNQQRDILREAGQGAREFVRKDGSMIEGTKQMGDAARRAWWVMIVPPLLQAMLFGNGPGGDDDDPESWAAYLTKAVMFGNVASIPGIGPIVNAIGNGYGYRSNAWQGIGEGITKAWEDADKAMEGEPIKGSSVKGVMTTLGIILAKPLGQVGATSQGVYDYARGEAEPEDVGDWYELLTKGRISEQPTAVERLAGEEAA